MAPSSAWRRPRADVRRRASARNLPAASAATAIADVARRRAQLAMRPVRPRSAVENATGLAELPRTGLTARRPPGLALRGVPRARSRSSEHVAATRIAADRCARRVLQPRRDLIVVPPDLLVPNAPRISCERAALVMPPTLRRVSLIRLLGDTAVLHGAYRARCSATRPCARVRHAPSRRARRSHGA